MKELQEKVNKAFKDAFGYSPLTERLEDIQREFFELMRWTDMRNLKEEAGDLLTSLIQLFNENGWDAEQAVTDCLVKIARRKEQYQSLGRKLKVALYGGSFNPITKGHIQVAQFVLDTSRAFDEVWLVPCYKHMYNKQLVDASHRLKMCEIAYKVDGRIKVFDFEIMYELGGETYNFVKRLVQSEFMDWVNFSYIIGQDNANTFADWVNSEHLMRMMTFVVVPRCGIEPAHGVDWYLKPPHIFLNSEGKEPTDIEISSTAASLFLADPRLRQGKDALKYLDPLVRQYIIENELYTELTDEDESKVEMK